MRAQTPVSGSSGAPSGGAVAAMASSTAGNDMALTGSGRRLPRREDLAALEQERRERAALRELGRGRPGSSIVGSMSIIETGRSERRPRAGHSWLALEHIAIGGSQWNVPEPGRAEQDADEALSAVP